MRKIFLNKFVLATFLVLVHNVQAQEPDEVTEYRIAEGWSNNSVNAVIFRKNSLVTHGNHQYAAFYDPEQFVILAKRKLGSTRWEVQRTRYRGNARDAHNSISIIIDGEGYLHMSWDHHNDTLRYVKSVAPGSLQLGEKLSMTGKNETSVSYPEFYRMPNGDLLFFYRDGESGRGNLVINRYHSKSKTWEQLQNNLIDGENQRNAYWQSCVDETGTIHVSWVWRETWDVSTNHDLSYARSRDGGKTWENSRGKNYTLPITAETAEIAYAIPQNSELINQTSMTTDSRGNSVIAGYWQDKGQDVPQYHIVYFDGKKWQNNVVSNREAPFSLSGGGTKRIPISRPQVLIKKTTQGETAFLLFRDLERGNKPSVAINEDFPEGRWEIKDLTEEDLGSWEPSYDTELWKSKGILGLFVQRVEQIDGEGVSHLAPTAVKVLEWRPK